MEIFEILHQSTRKDALPVLFVDVAAALCADYKRSFSHLSNSQSRQYIVLCSLDK